MFLSKFDFWGVVNGLTLTRIIDLVAQVAWKSKNLKTCFDLIFHYENSHIQLIRSLKESQEILAKLKSTCGHKYKVIPKLRSINMCSPFYYLNHNQ
jgi:predicted DNA-binding protein YlxM (UPF0122 family)